MIVLKKLNWLKLVVAFFLSACGGSGETGSPSPDEQVKVKSVAAGGYHSCALLTDGNVRCWGYGEFGLLGYGNKNSIGDDESPANAGNVDVGGIVAKIVTGDTNTCALLDTGALRCWGSDHGQAGSTGINYIGDDETPASVGDVVMAETVKQITVGFAHTCALLSTGTVRCWFSGQSTDHEFTDNVIQIAAGGLHTCVLLETHAVKCWGNGSDGQLGYGNTDSIQYGADAGEVNIGGPVTQIAAGNHHTCALLTSGTVRCWGANSSGQLGYGHTISIGDDDYPASAGDVNIGATVTQITAGVSHTCVLLSTGRIRCWGSGYDGKLGYGNTITIGDDEYPSSMGNIEIGGLVTQISAGAFHTCALLTTGNIRCWGNNNSGKLGYGHINNIGDDETPASVGDVQVLE